MKFTVGLAQIAPVPGDVAANLAIHLDAIRDARARGADLLIFPELSLTGYGLGDRAFDVAIRLDDYSVFGSLMDAAGNMDLVVSFIEEDERHRTYIAATYLSGGRIVHCHRKVYLPNYGLFNEGRTFTRGDSLRAFDTRFGRVGLLICEDYWHVSAPYILWQDGADLLILIAASVEHGAGEADSTAGRVLAMSRAYALLFTDFVIHVNQAGPAGEFRYWGGSVVYGPDAALLVQGPRNEPALVVATLDTADLRRARRELPLLRDERPELTARELARILRGDWVGIDTVQRAD